MAAAWRGGDEIGTGIAEHWHGVGLRSVTQTAVDQATGDEATTGWVLFGVDMSLIGIDVVNALRLGKTFKTLTKSTDELIENAPTTSVFHKGELVNGKVVNSRSLSTGVEYSSVRALSRTGAVHQFDIPTDILNRWKLDGYVQTIRDYDHVTGVINEELRFSGLLAEELNRYLRK